MNTFARAKSYIDKMPGAVSGDSGHDRTFTAACCVVRFGLSEADQWILLVEYNARCSPPWSEKDLHHKLDDARRRATPGELASAHYCNGRGRSKPKSERLPPLASVGQSAPKPAAVTCPDAPEADLPEPIELGASKLLCALYQPDECVRIVKGTIREGDDRETPEDGGIVLPVRDWLAKASTRGGDLSTLWSSASGAGVYVGMNPVKPGGTRDEDVIAFRFALVESDQISPEEQWGKICASKVPCAAVIDSGGKSVHAWVRVDAKDRREYDDRVAFLHAYFPWADTKNKNPGRLSRLPDVRRRGKRQRLLSLGTGCASWSEWLAEVNRQSVGSARSFADLFALDTTADPNCVLGFRDGKTLRYLCKGKSAWLLGPSGIGKSSLEAQFAVGWAIGAPVFGITPARPLRSLIVQAENDDYDLAEMVQGVAAAHGLHKDDPRWPDVARNVQFRTETSSFGARFCARLRDMIDADRPDVVWIDPLLSFAGIDVSKQDQVTPFLRELITPVLESTGVVMIGVHHTGKPRDAKATRDWTAIDWAYAGIGSSELVNWARAVMLLRPVENRTFELKLAKRGSRAGAAHPDGSPAYGSVWLQQATGRIYWEHVNPPEEPVEEPKESSGKPSGRLQARPGAPSKVETALAWDWLAVTSRLPPEGVSGREFYRRACAWMAVSGRRLSKETCLTVAAKLVESHRLGFDGDQYYPPKTPPK